LNGFVCRRDPNAIHIFDANPEKINWNNLSENPSAIHLLEANPEKIVWDCLSRNPSAIHLLDENLDKIDWGVSVNKPFCDSSSRSKSRENLLG
jgi:hypothetical protein